MNRRKYILLLLTGGILAIGSGFETARAQRRGEGTRPAVAATGLATADSLLEAGRPESALACILDLLKTHAEDPLYGWQLQDRRGVALLRMGRTREAIPLLEDSIRRHPGLAQGHRNLGSALVELGARGRALSEFAAAVDLDPGNFRLRLEYGQILLQFRNTGEAAKQLATAASLCQDCRDVAPAMARLYLLTGEYGAAADLLSSLYAEEPTAEHRRSLVQALQGAGRDSLLVDLLSGSSLAELPADELIVLVNAEGRLGKSERSREVLALMPESTPGPVATVPAAGLREAAGADGFWGQIALNLLAGGFPAEALAAVDRAIRLAPERAVHRNNRAAILNRLDRTDEAAAEYRRAVALDPELDGGDGAER